MEDYCTLRLLHCGTTAAERPVPRDWQWARMENITKLWNGHAVKSIDFVLVGIPVIRIGNLQGGEVVVSNAVCVK